ncbi:MAG: GNAT family N-acetyltransferase [Acidimicrobiia bacterium]
MHHLANVNVAKLRASLDDPLLADFVAGLPVVNNLADAAPGFVWRLQSDGGDATDIRAFPDPDVIVNLTVWESPEALKEFTYRGVHRDVFRRRSEWFHEEGRGLALWWVPAGTVPTVDDARHRLDFLRMHGHSPYSFTFTSIGEPFTIEPVTLGDARAARLIGALDAELEARYPEPGSNFFRLDPNEVTGDRGVVLLATFGGQAAGCGAVRMLDDTTGEIKRMYVAPQLRGRKLGAAMLSELERAADQLGAKRLVLETGTRQPEAMTVYERAGFTTVPCWGEYAAAPLSVCMEKVRA